MSGSDLEALYLFHLNAAGVEKPETEYRFAPPRRFRFDMAWPQRQLGVEIDGAVWVGGRHTRGYGIENDAEKYSIAAAAGWRVLRFTKAMIEDGRALALTEEALSR